MNILFLNYSDRNLATMIRSVELAKALSEQGHHVVQAFLNENFCPPQFFKDYLEKLKNSEFEFIFDSQKILEPQKMVTSKQHSSPPRLRGVIKQAISSLKYVPREMQLIKKVNPDVVIARPDGIFSFVISTFLKNRPLVLSTDGPVEELWDNYGIPLRWPVRLDKMRLNRAAGILYISEACGKLLRDKGYRNKLHLITNGANPEFFKPQPIEERNSLKEKLGLSGARVIGFSGNQIAQHGVGELLKASVEIIVQEKDVKVLVIGSLKATDSLALNELPENLKNNIVFTGPLDYREMPKYMDCADILTIPYLKYKTFFLSPMKMFEGMSMGKYLVGSTQGQIGEILKDQPEAFLYDVDDKQGLKKTLQIALNHLKKKPAEGQLRELLKQKYTWAKQGEIISSLCKDLKKIS